MASKNENKLPTYQINKNMQNVGNIWLVKKKNKKVSNKRILKNKRLKSKPKLQKYLSTIVEMMQKFRLKP